MKRVPNDLRRGALQGLAAFVLLGAACTPAAPSPTAAPAAKPAAEKPAAAEAKPAATSAPAAKPAEVAKPADKGAAPQAKPYFEGKTVTILVGGAPGGGVDASCRAETRLLGNYVAGKPSFVIRNQPGGSGTAVLNPAMQFGPDGLSLVCPGRQEWLILQLVKEPAVQFDARKFEPIGSLGDDDTVIFVRSATGVGSLRT